MEPGAGPSRPTGSQQPGSPAWRIHLQEKLGGACAFVSALRRCLSVSMATKAAGWGSQSEEMKLKSLLLRYYPPGMLGALLHPGSGPSAEAQEDAGALGASGVSD